MYVFYADCKATMVKMNDHDSFPFYKCIEKNGRIISVYDRLLWIACCKIREHPIIDHFKTQSTLEEPHHPIGGNASKEYTLKTNVLKATQLALFLTHLCVQIGTTQFV
ncbi:hypothetical protein AALO_G00127820 [Alosa alosa]|uniref:Uncharacterized protein n=1 Tax=Alosa alosa TaxID=278164 RepID=A0AAV6GLV0_9TELE|nr:hypothetical protein AALO_G00127820 [Alosa alosa]